MTSSLNVNNINSYFIYVLDQHVWSTDNFPLRLLFIRVQRLSKACLKHCIMNGNFLCCFYDVEQCCPTRHYVRMNEMSPGTNGWT